jgi:hypothetical protein
MLFSNISATELASDARDALFFSNISATELASDARDALF